MAKEKKTGIYKITNKSDGKIYIGQAKDIEIRWRTHKRTKYPEDHFTYEILMECDLEQLNFWEIAWIASENACDPAVGYNQALGGTSLKNIIKKVSNETKAKLSAINTGKKHTDETKAKISASLIGNTFGLGYKHKDESKEKMSISHIGMQNALGSVRTKEEKLNLSKKLGKACVINDIEYTSAREAALALGKHHSTVTFYLNNKIPWPNGMTGCWIKP